MSLLLIIAIVVAIALVPVAAFAIWMLVSCHPRIWLLRALVRVTGIDEAPARAMALRMLVPGGISERLDIPYAPGDRDALLDVFTPDAASTPLPALVWVHGGGWIGGTRIDMREYLQILASHGFATVGVEYSHAPRRHHPTPARQVNLALRYLREHADQLGIDAGRIVLAGDSAGAQIAAQVALASTEPDYAVRLALEPAVSSADIRAMILMCGIFDLALQADTRWSRLLTDSVLWAYAGVKDHRNDAAFGLASVARHLSSGFPPTLISVGNGDALARQSKLMAAALEREGVPTEAVFFDDYDPPLPHEYHLDLPEPAADLVLERIVEHVRRYTTNRMPASQEAPA